MSHFFDVYKRNSGVFISAIVSAFVLMTTFLAPTLHAETPPPPPTIPGASPARPIGRSERLDAIRNIRAQAQNQGEESAERRPPTPTGMRPMMQDIGGGGIGRHMNTTTAESLRERMSERREAHRATMDERRDERREAVTDAARARVRAFMERMLRRFDAAIQRLRNLADRVGTRIEKLETNKNDLGHAKELLGAARVEIDAAAATLAAIRANLESAVAEENPHGAFEAIHESLAEAKEAVRAAHRALIETIVAIRANSGRGEDGGATKTESN